MSSIEVSAPLPARDLSGPLATNDDPCIVACLVAIAKTTRVLLGIKVADLGLFAGQDDMLLVLEPGLPRMVTHIADDLNVRASTVSKMLDRMVDLGLVERTAKPDDARLTLVRLTAEGYRLREQIQSIRAKLGAEIEKQAAADGLALTAEDLQVLSGVLRKRLQRLR